MLGSGTDEQRQEFVLSKSDISLGRAATSDIVLKDNAVSRAHAKIECSGAGCVAVDLGSANGVKVNGKKVSRIELVSGDRISIGAATLVFKAQTYDTDDDVTMIDSDEELEATICNEPVVSQISETRGARLVIHTRTKTWEVGLDADAVTIGRLPGNDVVIDSAKASRRHARIEREGSAFILKDLNSDNGTWVGGDKVQTHRLKDSDTINIGGARLVFVAGYEEDDLTVMEGTRATGPRRPIVIIPGYMGSNLWLDEDRIWPNVRSLFKLPEVMKYEKGQKTPLVARGLVDEVVIVPNVIRQEQYGGLIDFLEESLGYERGKDLWEFAYDFRQDLKTTAAQLGAAIEGWSQREPVTIIAHSMGSLISRYYVDALGGHRHVERLMLLGGPHAGSPKAVTHLAVKPKYLPFGLVGSRIQEVMLTYPAIYHLLPEQPCGTDQHGNTIDWLHDESWLPEKYRPHLREAVSFRAELSQRCKVPTLCIFGYGMKTMTNLNVTRESDGSCSKIEPVFELLGDGTVPESMATLKGADIHPIQQYHGTLHLDSDVKKRLKVELTR